MNESPIRHVMREAIARGQWYGVSDYELREEFPGYYPTHREMMKAVTRE